MNCATCESTEVMVKDDTKCYCPLHSLDLCLNFKKIEGYSWVDTFNIISEIYKRHIHKNPSNAANLEMLIDYVADHYKKSEKKLDKSH